MRQEYTDTHGPTLAWIAASCVIAVAVGYGLGWFARKPPDAQLALAECRSSFLAATDAILRDLVSCKQRSWEQDSSLRDCREEVDHLLRIKHDRR